MGGIPKNFLYCLKILYLLGFLKILINFGIAIVSQQATANSPLGKTYNIFRFTLFLLAKFHL
jgi:hypothetical protein